MPVTTRRYLIAAVFMVSTAFFVLSPPAAAQLTDTQAFLADIDGQYRSVPNVVYHEANNHENSLDLYLPTNSSGPTPVLLMIHGGGLGRRHERRSVTSPSSLSGNGVGGRQRVISTRPS